MSGDPEEGATGIGALPGAARVGAELAWHSAGWAVGTSARVALRLARAATSAEAAGELIDDVRDLVRRTARDLIDVTDLEERLRESGAASSGVARAVASVVPPASASASVSVKTGRRGEHAKGMTLNGSLSAMGAELIRLSRDVHFQEESHPAYERILSELAPDEGRILLLLLTKGPQPAVDVRTGGPLGLISSKLIAPGLSMIGSRAGLRHVDKVPAYLNNLFRLGLVWFSHETVPDHMRYQVLEAQPDVLAAIHSVRQARVVRRSIHLTPFGEDFCRTCLPVPSEQLESLPEHSAPPEEKGMSQPPSQA